MGNTFEINLIKLFSSKWNEINFNELFHLIKFNISFSFDFISNSNRHKYEYEGRREDHFSFPISDWYWDAFSIG